jgi:hypothetical protein
MTPENTQLTMFVIIIFIKELIPGNITSEIKIESALTNPTR